MIKKFYYWLRNNVLSRPEEGGEPSAGYFQGAIRSKALDVIALSKGSLLEVGCGEGFFLKKVIESYPMIQVFGVELLGEQVERAKKRLPDSVLIKNENAANMSFSNEQFDRVVCVNVFMNLPTDQLVADVLSEIKRVLKKDAKLIFDIRNLANPLMFLKYKTVKYYDDTIDESELRMFSLKDFEKRLETAGLKIKKIHPLAWPFVFMAPAYIIEAEKK